MQHRQRREVQPTRGWESDEQRVEVLDGEGQPLYGTNCIHAETISIFDLTVRSRPFTVEHDVLADGADLRGMRIALTPMLRTPIQTVSLKAPIAGRGIEGEGMSETAINSFSYLAITRPDGLRIPAVPSVIGLAPADAVRVLSQRGFVAVLDGHGREVLDQHPRRGERARNRQAAVYDAGEPVRILAR
jgi:hypothetical protein